MKKVLLSIFIIIGLISYKPFVSSFFLKDSDIKLVYKLSNNIFLEDDKLKENILIFKSEKNISDYYLHSTCNTSSNFLEKRKNYYFFSLKYISSKCNDPYIYLKNTENNIILNSQTKVNLITKTSLINKFIDYPNYYLNKINKSLKKNTSKYSLYSKLNLELSPSLKYISKYKRYHEAKNTKETIEYILNKRKEKYLIPVIGYSLPTRKDKIPNAARPYRDKYTDGIHHSWDIDTPFGEEVISLDDAIVVRVVNNWKWQDFTKLQYGELTREQRRDNLDILRGNQIWIKTMKGDVIFYGHLDKVYNNIKVGDFIKSGTPMGTIGVSGVPDKKYKDYHLDFSIQRNPYDVTKAGKYSLEDYMQWKWYFAGASKEFILANQYDVFKENLVVKNR